MERVRDPNPSLEHDQGLTHHRYYFSDPGAPGKETKQASDMHLAASLWELSTRLIKENVGDDALQAWSA